jgi:hypothetical protein
MRILRFVFQQLVGLLKIVAYEWAVGAYQMIRRLIAALCELWRRRKLPHDKRHPEQECLQIQHPSLLRPDPTIYSQLYLMKLGLPVTWDNPDIRLFRNGAQVDEGCDAQECKILPRCRFWRSGERQLVSFSLICDAHFVRVLDPGGMAEVLSWRSSSSGRRREHGEGEFILHRLWRVIEIHRVMAETIDVARLIRTDKGKRFGADPIAVHGELANHFGHGHHIVEDQQICHEMIVLDDFPLFLAPIFGNDPFTAKEQPFQKAVKRFALVHGA